MQGVELDGDPKKKKALINFLLCLPELLEAALKKKHITKGFVEAGMIDEETRMVPSFESLMSTCKRWTSASKVIGTQKSVKDHCWKQFQPLMQQQLENGQITYADMKATGIPLSKNDDSFLELYCIIILL